MLCQIRKRVVSRKFLLTIVRGLFLFALLTAPVFMGGSEVFAQNTEVFQQVGAQSGLAQESLPILVARVIRAVLGILGIILVIVVLYAGFIYLTAGGDAQKVDRAKRILKQAGIGVVIIFLSFAITQFILGRLLGGGFGSGGRTNLTTVDRFSEPRSGSLGAGGIEDHYPARDAFNIPRNTMIFITFEKPLDPASVITGYSEETRSGELNAENIFIYQTADGIDSTMAGSDFVASLDETGENLVIDPKAVLPVRAEENTNYTIYLDSGVQSADGSPVFSGRFDDGYQWTFSVVNEIDLTPPTVRYITPRSGSTSARNSAVEITFSEPMNPLATSGVYQPEEGEEFDNITLSTGENGPLVAGKYVISNHYQTVTFTTFDVCAENACGDLVYCLPRSEEAITARARTAPLGSTPPQAQFTGGVFDGVVDAAGNALDGAEEFDPESPPAEFSDFVWSFQVDSYIDRRTPEIVADPLPGLPGADGTQKADIDSDVQIPFNMPILASSVRSDAVSLWPDPDYEFWFRSVVSTEISEAGERSRIFIKHPTLIPETEEGGWNYFPVITHKLLGSNQFCMYPAKGPGFGGDNGSCGTTEAAPHCCNGRPSPTACTNGENPARQFPLPEAE